MRTDAVIIGAELDGWVAAIRLAECGRSVCLVAPGAGSLHYASGSIHLLGFVGNGAARRGVAAPFDELPRLDPRHPYSLAGASNVAQAVRWAEKLLAGTDAALADPADAAQNTDCITPAGVRHPALLPAAHRATFGALAGRKAAIVQFEGHRDFPAALLESALSQAGIAVSRTVVAPPDAALDNTGLARSFDLSTAPRVYFAGLRRALPRDCELALFPAVLGLRRHRAVIEAARAGLDMPVLEVPTLPPSVPGFRLARMLEHRLAAFRVPVRKNCRIVAGRRGNGALHSIVDEAGRAIEASSFVLATGGVLMGGLAVGSDGVMTEPVLGLAVAQGRPLAAASPAATLAALNDGGVETDRSFRPMRNGAVDFENVYVTGRTLAHWQPAEELSSEGVALASGWSAAECAHAQMGG